MEEIIIKHNKLYKEFDDLYQKYKFNDLLDMRKGLEGNFATNSKKYLEINNNKMFNYLYFYEMYVQIFKTECDFVLFSIQNSNLETNITKNINNYIACQNGYRWIKIISKSIDVINNSLDENYYGDYCITEEMDKFIEDCQNIKYLPFDEKPELYVIFYEKPNEEVCDMISNKNINIKIYNELPIEKPKFYTKFENIKVLNIDVNVIVTLCSEICNLDDNAEIKEEIIKRCLTGEPRTMKDVIENKNFIINTMNKFDKKIICKSAFNKICEFTKSKSVVSFCPKEIVRLKCALDKYNIEIVEDNISQRIKEIKHPNKLANCVFGTADYHKAITLTAYNSYANHAKQYRIQIPIIHCKSVEFSEKFLH